MTATPAQAARLALVRHDTTNRITTRHLGNGDIRITEYDGRDKASVDMTPDGLYR